MLSQESLAKIDRDVAKYPADQKRSAVMGALRIVLGFTFLWAFVDHRPQVNTPRGLSDLPAQTPRSLAMSKALKREGFNFVGPTITYAFMQASGMVNDHLVNCPHR